MLEAMVRKNGYICDDSESSCGESHEMYDETHSLSDYLEQNRRDKIYIWVFEPTNGTKVLWRTAILFISQRQGGRGGLFREKGRWLEVKDSL